MDKLEASKQAFGFWSKLPGRAMGFCTLCLIAAICSGFAYWYSNYRQAPQVSSEMAEWQRIDTANWNRQHISDAKVARELLAIRLLLDEHSKKLRDADENMAKGFAALAKGRNDKLDEMVDIIKESNADVGSQIKMLHKAVEKYNRSTDKPSIEVHKKPLSQMYDMFNPFKLTAHDKRGVFTGN
jgi:hypothetical protein